jgi:secondary thiamine-phosphate synthase enzyme
VAVSSLHHTLHLATRGKGLYPFTRDVAKWVASTGVQSGLLTVFVQHTSASLVIQENADPDVVLDLADFFERLAPEDDRAIGTLPRVPMTCRRTSAPR